MPSPSVCTSFFGMQQVGWGGSVPGAPALQRGGALAVVPAICLLLSSGSAIARVGYTTFDVGEATSINSSNTVAGIVAGDSGNSFVRTEDGTVTTFAVSGATDTLAFGINDGGVVAGLYFDADSGPPHGYVRAADGTVTTFDIPGSSATQALSINTAGAITGYYEDSQGLNHGFVRAADGTITTFDVSGSTGTFPASINDRGTITGVTVVNDVTQSFVRTIHGAIATFTVPGATATTATSINRQGTVTGSYGNGNGSSGFTRTSTGTITTFDVGCDFFAPVGINRRNEIAGYCQNEGARSKGVIRHPDGRIQYFHVPNGGSTAPSGINDAGVIAGGYSNGIGGFLRFP